MVKEKLHYLWKKLPGVSYGALFAAGLVLFFVFIFAFRQNNVTMLRLRDEVFKSDEQDGDVEAALRKLREHVHSHMNTDLTPKNDSIRPPIQLKYRYERLVAAEKARVKAKNDAIYSDATSLCEARFPAGQLANGRVQCVQSYVTENSVKEKTIPDSLYKFDFVSPVWSPDLAGWSLAFAVLFAVLGLIRLLIERRPRLHK